MFCLHVKGSCLSRELQLHTRALTGAGYWAVLAPGLQHHLLPLSYCPSCFSVSLVLHHSWFFSAGLEDLCISLI